MNFEFLFQLSYFFSGAGWLAIILVPYSKLARRITFSCVIPCLLAAIYVVVLALMYINEGGSGGGFFSLELVKRSFQNSSIALVSWYHFLALDLFVGSWAVYDARQAGISHWVLVSCMIFVFLVGPVGLLFYLLVRFLLVRKVMLMHDPETFP